MHRIFRVKAYEAEHGPHFNEEHARKAVSKMENEDGTRGPHWSVEETTALASQYGINLGSRFNRYDWFVALNMVYSDYYKVIIRISREKRQWLNAMKKWPSVKYYQISWEQIMNQLERMIKYQNYRKKLVS